MDFDILVEQINKQKQEEGDECLICRFPVNNKEMINLNCKHIFHNDCLITNKKWISVVCPYCMYKTINNSNICKFCFTKGQYKGKRCGKLNCSLHKTYKLCKHCTYITNKKNNTICGINNCTIHNDLYTCNTDSCITHHITVPVAHCTIVIKSGKNKGLICGKPNCKTHKTNNIICKTILKSGKNKGLPCGKSNCKQHKIIDMTCKSVLKSGNNKGMQCGKINCKKHVNHQ
jgi:hypothetical protein